MTLRIAGALCVAGVAAYLDVPTVPTRTTVIASMLLVWALPGSRCASLLSGVALAHLGAYTGFWVGLALLGLPMDPGEPMWSLGLSLVFSAPIALRPRRST